MSESQEIFWGTSECTISVTIFSNKHIHPSFWPSNNKVEVRQPRGRDPLLGVLKSGASLYCAGSLRDPSNDVDKHQCELKQKGPFKVKWICATKVMIY